MSLPWLSLLPVSDQAGTAEGGQCVHGTLVVIQITNVPDGEDDHDSDHEDGVKDVEEDLVGDQVAAIALEIFDNTESASDQDQEAGGVECK